MIRAPSSSSSANRWAFASRFRSNVDVIPVTCASTYFSYVPMNGSFVTNTMEDMRCSWGNPSAGGPPCTSQICGDWLLYPPARTIKMDCTTRPLHFGSPSRMWGGQVRRPSVGGDSRGNDWLCSPSRYERRCSHHTSCEWPGKWPRGLQGFPLTSPGMPPKGSNVTILPPVDPIGWPLSV